MACAAVAPGIAAADAAADAAPMLPRGVPAAPQPRAFAAAPVRRAAAVGACLLGVAVLARFLAVAPAAGGAAAAAVPTDRSDIVELAAARGKVAAPAKGWHPSEHGWHVLNTTVATTTKQSPVKAVLAKLEAASPLAKLKTAVQTRINETKAQLQAKTPLGQLQIAKAEKENDKLNKVHKTVITSAAANGLLARARQEGWGADKTEKHMRIASCTLNVLQASNYLARAGLTIDAATKACRAPDSAYKKEACAADAAGVFSSVAWVATYLSLAASQCARHIHGIKVDAVCAATIEGLVAALGGLVVQANFVAANCLANSAETAAANTETDSIWQMSGRRLQSYRIPADRDAELATCVLDATEAATALAQMGLNIKAAARSCPLWHYTQDVAVVRGNTHAICSLDIGHVLWSVGQAASFIAAATSHCAEGINVQALCASGIAGLVSSLAGVVYLGSGVRLACVELEKLGYLEHPVAKALGQGIARRLGSAANSTPSPHMV